MSVSLTRTIRDTQVMMLPCSGEVDLGDRIDGSTISQDFTARVGRGRGCKTVEMFKKKQNNNPVLFLDVHAKVISCFSHN